MHNCLPLAVELNNPIRNLFRLKNSSAGNLV